ncbi:MAG TPA: hypothetical protein PLH72_17720 [Vicinamibacterales bacterium]|nr:hypothetical protein [Vicinamibacterales bacterium]
MFARGTAEERGEAPETPKRLLFELLRPQSPRTDLAALGSIIIADEIRARAEIYGADEQTSHPYTIGDTEIEPAADQVLTNDERLSIAFQVFNAAPSPSGKPDVAITFRLFRKTETGEEAAAALAGRRYARAADTLAGLLATSPGDDEAQWLMLQALFAGRIAGGGPGATEEGRQRLVALATKYIDAGGRHGALADEWRDFATSSGSAAP